MITIGVIRDMDIPIKIVQTGGIKAVMAAMRSVEAMLMVSKN